MRFRDRRAHRRFDPPVSLRFSSIEESGFLPVDISAGGARLCVGARLAQGSAFTLVVGPPRCRPLLLRGEVVWSAISCRSKTNGLPYEIGVSFNRSNPQDLDLLAKYL
jgi:hypothetical protein